MTYNAQRVKHSTVNIKSNQVNAFTMRTIFLLMVTALLSRQAGAQFRSANLQAAGLTCAMCTKAISKSLDKLSFIQEVKPDIKTSSFNITFKEGANVDFDALEKSVE